jgi:putative oxidoreductase
LGKGEIVTMSLIDKVNSIGRVLQSPFLLIIRLYWGFQFALTGFGKFLALGQIAAYFQSLGIPLPHLNAVLSATIELVCGSLLFLGLYSRITVIPLFGVMLIAYLTAGHDALIALFTQFNPDPFFNNTAFLFLYAITIVFCFGPGKFSLDYFLSRARTDKEKMP